MCVILIGKKSNISKYLEDAIAANPHGVGFAIPENGNYYFLKGLMEKEEIYEAFGKLPDVELILHARLSSGSAVVPYLTHPFIITDDRRTYYTTLEGYSDMLLFHNGTIRELCDPTKSYLSDTLLLAERLATEQDQKRLLSKYAKRNNKFVFCTPQGVSTFGHFHMLDDNVLASNTYFLYKRSSFSFTCELCGQAPVAKLYAGLLVCHRCYEALSD